MHVQSQCHCARHFVFSRIVLNFDDYFYDHHLVHIVEMFLCLVVQ